MTLYVRCAGRDNSRGIYGPKESSSTSPYRESGNSFRQQEAPGHRAPDVHHQQQQQQKQLQHQQQQQQQQPPLPQQPQSFSYKAQGDKYRSMLESSGPGRYQRERVNSLDKSSPAYYGGAGHVRGGSGSKQSGAEGTGSIGARHQGCSVSISEANVCEIYGAMKGEQRPEPPKILAPRIPPPAQPSNVAKQRSFEAAQERESCCRSDRDKDFRRPTACNNSADSE
jgi:hypothetical protein